MIKLRTATCRCGATFQTTNSRKRNCSRRCAQDAAIAAAPTYTLTCPCGVQFTSRHKHQKHHSRECAQAHQARYKPNYSLVAWIQHKDMTTAARRAADDRDEARAMERMRAKLPAHMRG